MFRQKLNSAEAQKIHRLYQKHRNLAFHISYSILKDIVHSEDAVHESFIKISKNIDKIDEENEPVAKSYIAIICRNTALDMYKKLKHTAPVEDIDGFCSEECDPEKIIIDNETFMRVVDAITELPPKYRDVLLMRRVYRFSRCQIAEILSLSEDTVKKRLQRAKAKLKEQIKEGGKND